MFIRTGDQTRRLLLQVEAVQVRRAKWRLRRSRDRVVVLYQSLDEKTRVCRRSAPRAQGPVGSGHISRDARQRVQLPRQHQRGGAERGQDYSKRDTSAS